MAWTGNYSSNSTPNLELPYAKGVALKTKKKRYPTPKDKEEATSRWWEGCIPEISNLIPTGWVAHKLENKSFTEALP